MNSNESFDNCWGSSSEIEKPSQNFLKKKRFEEEDDRKVFLLFKLEEKI